MSRRAPSAPLAAYVLHRYDWSESSLIVELFTRERGRLVVVAKGAKRPYSQLRPVLLPFQRLNVTLGRAPADETAEMHNLRSAEWGGGAPMPGGASLFRGFYLNELLLKLLARQDPHPALFDAYAQTLPALIGPDSPSGAAALRAFELVLLRETGVLPQLDLVTVTHRPLSPDEPYALQADIGIGPAAGDGADAGVPGRVWIALQGALADQRLGAVQAACLEALTPLRLQLRALLHYHLEHKLLRTRSVMLDVQRFIDTRAQTP